LLTDSFDQLKAACCRIVTPFRIGTGYLAGDGQVMTCEHIVRELDRGAEVEIFFSAGNCTATIVEKDEVHDSALLRLNQPAPEVAPLRFAGRCARQAVWDGYGFPELAKGIALPLRGVVMDPAGQDTKLRPALLLFSDQIATKTDIHGFSGSPVMVNGYVVGHLKRIMADDGDTSKAAFGYVFASPSERILSLLKMEPAVQAIDGEQPRPICIPALSEGSLHAFISSNSADRAFAKRLLYELDAKGFRVAADWVSGSSAMNDAATAVLVVSKPYLDSALSRAETDAILARRAAGQLRIIAVVVDDSRLPLHWMPALSYSFLGLPKPEGSVLEQVLYAVAGQRPPVRALAATVPTPVSADPEKGRSLVNAGLPELALKYLPASDTSVRVRQIRALALAKNRQLDEALILLEGLKREGHLDSESAGLLAGRYRQRWEETGLRNFLTASLETYLSAWESSNPRDCYPGINAASMLLWAGDGEQSKILARDVLAEALAHDHAGDFWALATIAEANLLLGESSEALRFYKRMVAAGPERYENIASARRTLRRDIEYLGLKAEPFETALTLPKVAAFVGHDLDQPDRSTPRFPPEREREVRRMIFEALKSSGILFGVSSASAGSDIIFLEEMRARNGFVRVVLPCARGQFIREFLDAGWRRRFERAMDHPRAEVVELDGDPDDLWETFRPKLLQYAEATARQLDDEPMLLAVWDGQPGFIAQTVSEWRGRGAHVQHLSLAFNPLGANSLLS
jgi:hypothetical protein